jgi:hypothetical protein
VLFAVTIVNGLTATGRASPLLVKVKAFVELSFSVEFWHVNKLVPDIAVNGVVGTENDAPE